MGVKLSSYEVLLDPDRLIDLTVQPLSALRELRTKCEHAEATVSFTRRVLHGRIDIVEHDLARRRAGSASRELGDLVDQLPMILAEPRRQSAPRSGRPVHAVAPDCVQQDLLAAVEEIAPPDVMAGLANASLSEVESIIAAMRVLEHELSLARHGLHQRIDSLQGELAGRYERGDADLASLAQSF